MKRKALIAAAVLAAGLAGVLLFMRSLGMFASDPVFTTERGAIDGYDPVAYFTEGKAVRGESAHTFDWNGSTWRFANVENQGAFMADPESFAPRYGGYCAYGMSEGYRAFTDPKAFTIVDGRLYLNFDAGVMEKWRESKDERIPRADTNWAKKGGN